MLRERWCWRLAHLRCYSTIQELLSDLFTNVEYLSQQIKLVIQSIYSGLVLYPLWFQLWKWFFFHLSSSCVYLPFLLVWGICNMRCGFASHWSNSRRHDLRWKASPYQLPSIFLLPSVCTDLERVPYLHMLWDGCQKGQSFCYLFSSRHKWLAGEESAMCLGSCCTGLEISKANKCTNSSYLEGVGCIVSAIFDKANILFALFK